MSTFQAKKNGKYPSDGPYHRLQNKNKNITQIHVNHASV